MEYDREEGVPWCNYSTMGGYHPRAPAALFAECMREHDTGSQAVGRRDGYTFKFTFFHSWFTNSISFAGIQGFQSQPLVSWENAQADIIQVCSR